MALILAESLRDRSAFDAADVSARYLAWYKDGAFDSGPVWHNVMSRIARGIPALEASRQVHIALNELTAGCNPAHRCVAIACAQSIIADEQVGRTFFCHFERHTILPTYPGCKRGSRRGTPHALALGSLRDQRGHSSFVTMLAPWSHMGECNISRAISNDGGDK
jgi:hypothetical protein